MSGRTAGWVFWGRCCSTLGCAGVVTGPIDPLAALADGQ
jgi:hypothetical protein